KEFSDGRKTRIVDGEGNEEAGGDAPEKAAHEEAIVDAPEEGAHEEAAAEQAAPEEGAHEEALPEEAAPEEGGHEEAAAEQAAPEEGAHEEALPEEGAHEEAADVEAPAEEPVDKAAADEELGDEEPLEHPPLFIDMGDDEDDEVNSHVEPMVVKLLDTFVGDPRATVDLFRLHYLGCLLIKFVVFFKTHFLNVNKKKIAKRHVWQVSDYQPYFRNDLVRVEELLSADWVRMV
ncbi:hypothetical protein V8G54_022237, partial [Vigna mungo]